MKLKKLALIAEILASFAVIISLVLLLLEIRGNTLAMERQTEMAHYDSLFNAFVEPTALMSAMVKIKAVDGIEADVAAFMSTYDLSETEATAWSRFQLLIWAGMQQRFVYEGPSKQLAEEISQLLRFPDVVLFLEHSPPPEAFMSYIESVKMDNNSET